jgi:hypothetical protein
VTDLGLELLEFLLLLLSVVLNLLLCFASGVLYSLGAVCAGSDGGFAVRWWGHVHSLAGAC